VDLVFCFQEEALEPFASLLSRTAIRLLRVPAASRWPQTRLENTCGIGFFARVLLTSVIVIQLWQRLIPISAPCSGTAPSGCSKVLARVAASLVSFPRSSRAAADAAAVGIQDLASCTGIA